MKVLIADKFPEQYIQKLKDADLEVVYNPKLGEDDLPEAAKNVDCLIVRSTVVTAKTIEASRQLNLIVRAGAGVNNIDIASANKKGVYVSNCPGKNSIAVAELAIGLILALDRRIPNNVIDFKAGKWNKGEYSKAEGLFGKNIAIVGYGNIGKEVAKRAEALGMTVYANDVSPINDENIIVFTEFDKIIPIADVISVHLPQTPATKNFFNEKMFALMKKGTIFINTSRAGVVNEDALINAVKEKNLKVGFDVFAGEPEGKDGPVSSKLQELDNVYVTHHIGASTEQAQNAVAEETVNIILNYIKSGFIANWVNRAKIIDAHFQLILKHFDRPGVLASVMDLLRDGDINIEEVENIIFEGGMVACCSMKLKSPATSAMLESIGKNPNIISYSQINI
jgi:D-3-phosphoglycerate dehydrogenase / 2-oxoglutarate reductase